ncbi:MAG TPA: rhodanese-like domain-containing protein [Rhizomicrobium sp.]|nr:rhodanese-like domain-containing protein [Rhizomicrobium sp.]
MIWKDFLFAAILVTATTAHAATPRDDLLVTPGWLASHASDKDLVILHVGTDEGYHVGHIPGARLVKDLLSVNTPDLTMEVPSPDVLRQKMEALGISDNSRIVVYNENGEFQRGTRVMFSLDAAGFGDRSMLLDGGLAEWRKEGRAVTSDATQITEGHLSPLKMQPIVVDANFVQSHLKSPDYDLIDARDAVFYGGLVAKLDGDGHIPGARSFPYTNVMNSDGKLKSPEELRQMFTSAGYKPGDHVIAYCQVGGQSSAVMFAGRTLGLDLHLYDGSFQDWSKRHLPVESSTSPDK